MCLHSFFIRLYLNATASFEVELGKNGIILVHNGCNEVCNPSNGASADNPKNSHNDKEIILLINSLDYTVDSPDNIKEGEAKNNFCNKGEIVD